MAQACEQLGEYESALKALSRGGGVTNWAFGPEPM